MIKNIIEQIWDFKIFGSKRRYLGWGSNFRQWHFPQEKKHSTVKNFSRVNWQIFKKLQKTWKQKFFLYSTADFGRTRSSSKSSRFLFEFDREKMFEFEVRLFPTFYIIFMVKILSEMVKYNFKYLKKCQNFSFKYQCCLNTNA